MTRRGGCRSTYVKARHRNACFLSLHPEIIRNDCGKNMRGRNPKITSISNTHTTLQNKLVIFKTTAKTFLPCVRWSRSGSEGYIAGTLSWSATGCRTSCAEAACRCATPPGMKAVSFGGRGGFGYLVNFSFNNTVTLRAFSDLASVSFVISLVSFCLHICWTQDESLTRNRFSSKAICDQVRLRHRCGVLILICGIRKYDIAEV